MSTPIDDIARADSELSLDTSHGGTSFRQKILDIWWRICSKTGLTKFTTAIAWAVLRFPIPKLDASWAPTKVNTDTFTEIAANAQNFKNTQDKADAAKAAADAAKAAVDQLRADLPGLIANAVANQPAAVASIDANAVAEAVFQRLKAQANK